MPQRTTTRLDLVHLLDAMEQAPPVQAADVLGQVLGNVLGASQVAFLIADFSGDALIRLGHADGPAAGRRRGRERAERVPLEGTVHGRVLERQEVAIEPSDDGVLALAPVTNRGEAIGVIEATLPAAPDEAGIADLAAAAGAFAYVVIANRRFTDLYEWGQRSVPLSLAAEIQHRLLPSAYTCEAGRFTIAAWLEPAGDIAGDTFDFSVDRDVLHLSMTDAMGHATHAAVLATVLVGALRNARRAGAGIEEQAGRASEALVRHTTGEGFVTGQLVRVDLASGVARIVNAGHPPPIRLRGGRVDRVALDADLPFGVEPGQAFHARPLSLQPGDRLVFVTDGMLERNAATVDLAGIVAEGGALHAREAVRRLVGELLAATDGSLRDDATVMCLDWHGDGPVRRR